MPAPLLSLGRRMVTGWVGILAGGPQKSMDTILLSHIESQSALEAVHFKTKWALEPSNDLFE